MEHVISIVEGKVKVMKLKLEYDFKVLKICAGLNCSRQVWVIGEFASSSHDSGCTVQNIVQYFEVYMLSHLTVELALGVVFPFPCLRLLICGCGCLHSSKQIVILLFNPNCVLFLGV